MRTTTFYSYKGGTGRTLLLANLAVLAARLGRNVVAIDFDLEAPGLAYKLSPDVPLQSPGLVGWLRDALNADRTPATLVEYLMEVPVEGLTSGGRLRMMPAGRAPSADYFQDLTRLRLDQRLEDGSALDALIALQQQVEELGADVLLIDARTGITSTNRVTTQVLADDVVVLALDTREQLEGTRSVLRALQPLTSLRTNEPLGLEVVLSRVPPRAADLSIYANTDSERAELTRIRAFLNEPTRPLRNSLNVERIHLLHTELSLNNAEFLTMARLGDSTRTPFHVDTWRIAESLFGPDVETAAVAALSSARSDPDRLETLGHFFVALDAVQEARGALARVVAPASTAPHLPPETGLEEQVYLLRRQASNDPTVLPALAARLLTVADRLAELGRRVNAVAPAEESVAVYRDLVETNQSFLPDLASALNNLGNRYAEVGRRGDALAPTEEAVNTYRDLAGQNPRYVPDLAISLNNLGNRYAEVGRRSDALARTEEAVNTYRDLAGQNPRYVPDLAMSLNDLGNRYAEVGRRSDALARTEEAVNTYRDLAGQNPSHLPNLASALNNLGIRYAELGRRGEALVHGEKAATAYRALAEATPGYLANLASVLNNLGAHYAGVGRRGDALATTEEAVSLRRALAEENAGVVPDLASALNNLGSCYAEVGRYDDALAPTQEAVALYRTQADNNSGYLPDLAQALNNLGARYADVGRYDDALIPTEEAVALYRTQAKDNPGYLPDLAKALNSLGNRCADLGRRLDSVRAAQEAVKLYRELADSLPSAFIAALADALSDLSRHAQTAQLRGIAKSAQIEADELRRSLFRGSP